ncbi:hybrid sensor histidine kinase/response regulator [Burkholderia pseudomultivorans]|uniref:hybrid sensor histidine kinase/response regulator n=1 Tax=Burkholderia pseudomultivorans TaxID=1207504 RepID=UPI00189093CB|nr:hybrid sensor histidine kinase/response regulator [Burkholderia pseudomultivorans]MBF5013156.1 response regulator [Burkholderia pseudomultivorans]
MDVKFPRYRQAGSAHRTLDELRRYHRLLIAAGRWAAALVMLVVLCAEVVYLVSDQIADERQMVLIDYRLIRGKLNANENSFLNALVRAELTWPEERPGEPGLVEQFKRNGRMLRWRPFKSEPFELLIVGDPDASLPDVEIEQYLFLARQIGRANIAGSRVLQRELVQYVFSEDRKILAVMPVSSFSDMPDFSDVGERRKLMRELTSAFDGPTGAGEPRAANQAGTPHWSRSLAMSLSGGKVALIASPVVTDGMPRAILVHEVRPDDLMQDVVAAPFPGTYGIVSDTGKLIVAASTGRQDLAELERHARKLGRHVPSGDEMLEWHDDGCLIFTKRLESANWTLMYTYSWTNLVTAIRGQVLWSLAFVLMGGGIVWGVLGLLNRRIFEPMYERSQEEFEGERLNRILVETVPLGVGLVSASTGDLIVSSPAMREVSHRLSPRARDILFRQALRFLRRHSATNDDGVDRIFEKNLTLPTRDGGKIALSVRFALGRYRGERVLVTAFIDMTVYSLLRRQLVDAKQASDRANAAKSAFLAAMSHEIRTPLNAILGNLELVLHSPLDVLQRDRLQVIQTASKGLVGVISDVLDFSKIEAGMMQFERVPFDVSDVVSHSLAMFAPTAQAKGIALFGVFDLPIGRVVDGDPIRFGQVVNNLLSNAIKFTSCGCVKLTLRAASIPALGAGASQEGIEVVVEDTGIGISPAELQGLFKAFSQGSTSITRRFGGTGLGLALCRRLVEGMGGEVSVSSEEGVGSRFAVRIPAGVERSESGRQDAQRFDGESVAVLAADDEWHEFARAALARSGLVIATSYDPDELPPEGGRLLIVFGDWVDAVGGPESELAQRWKDVILCRVDGPFKPSAHAHVCSVSCYAPAGLLEAVAHVLHGKPLPSGGEGDATGTLPDMVHGGLRVLVVEDNETNRMLISEQLRLLGCVATLASDGQRALQIMSEATFDVVLADLHMPRMDGFTFADIVRGRWPSIPVAAVTADATTEEHARCSAVGIRAIATKPLSLAGLSALLSELTGTGARVGSAPRDDQAPLLGERELPSTIVASLESSCRATLRELREAVGRDDADTLAAKLHALKGMLGIFQEPMLVARCESLERHVGAQGGAGLDVRLDAFERELSARFAGEDVAG